ncbi:MAG: entericidin A/B family lipoprotein [Methylophaga sp.]|jgi:predicted small secreted protein|nr:entericidin A/B family lipoprotein [Methylophaga sp.]MEC9313665.1 entericidin A/B family lipoprotein [Pseudomonadota bacterium]MED5508928.1 entericidin A/B family lipoprotein [Pseudomonadota bacterium]
MKFMTSAILGLTIAFAVSACNTIEGAGEDIEAGGDAIEDAAE